MSPFLLPGISIVGIVTLVGSILNFAIGVVQKPDPIQYKRSWLKLTIMVSLVFVLLLSSNWGQWSLLPIVLLLTYLSWQELLKGVEKQSGKIHCSQIIWIFGLLSIFGGLAGGSAILMAIIIAIWAATFGLLIVNRRPIPLSNLFLISFGMCLISLPLSCLLAISNAHGLFTFLVIISMANDGFSEGIGRLFGKAKICPEISPGKSWAGAMGGLASSLIIGCGLKFLVPDWEIWFLLMITSMLSMSLLIGDILFSSIKREIGIKDFGTALGVTGGILDKFDGLMFAIPVFYLLINLMNY